MKSGAGLLVGARAMRWLVPSSPLQLGAPARQPDAKRIARRAELAATARELRREYELLLRP